MASKDAFNAAKMAFCSWGGFFKEVAQEIGAEKAIALYAKSGEAFEAWFAQTTRERLGNQTPDLNTFASARSEAVAVLGMIPEIGSTPNSVKFGWRQCPIYEGLRMAGLEHATIEEMCKRSVEAGYAEITKAFPQLTGALQFRSAPDQPCVEEFALNPVAGV